MVCRSGGDDRGATLVEFALLLPVLVMLLFGLVEFGITYDRQQALTGSAREGARAASIGLGVGQIENRVTASLAGTNFDATPVVTITPTDDPPCDGGNAGNPVKVEVEVDNQVEIPFVTSRTITLSAQGSFLCE